MSTGIEPIIISSRDKHAKYLSYQNYIVPFSDTATEMRYCFFSQSGTRCHHHLFFDIFRLNLVVLPGLTKTGTSAASTPLERRRLLVTSPATISVLPPCCVFFRPLLLSSAKRCSKRNKGHDVPFVNSWWWWWLLLLSLNYLGKRPNVIIAMQNTSISNVT